jgi:hypothetical protein
MRLCTVAGGADAVATLHVVFFVLSSWEKQLANIQFCNGVAF